MSRSRPGGRRRPEEAGLAGRIIAALAGVIAAAAATPVMAAPHGPPRDAAGPVLPYLAEEDYEQARPRILEELRLQGGSPCGALAAYAGNRNNRVREHAVRALADAGCTGFESYRAYLEDPDAWVIDAVIDAAGRHLMPDAVPFLLAHVSDARHIVTDGGAWTIGDSAHRALQGITCQSFHYDPAGTADDRRNALTRWRQWYLEHRDEPRAVWVRAGIERARDYAGRDYAPHRLEGLQLLALIGGPALQDLRALLARAPEDVQAEVSCQPEEPPRPTDRVPCSLLVRNASKRRLVIAPPPGGPVVRVDRGDESADPSPAGGGSRRAGGAAPPPAPPGREPTVGSAAVLAALAQRLVDLAPGEVRRYEFSVGPVRSAGRYRVRATLADLAADLVADIVAAPAAPPTPSPPSPRPRDPRGSSKGKRAGDASKPGAAPAPASGPRAPAAIEAETSVRFEQ